ncbi:Heterogeneous nuclear ribonucleoprotein 1 [Apostasia shenzhenica]|uniref:Heterogeneous nuclear ribonucleoprotein 1 n=1 Tax=Apostasia shenzhenica TaxID=1088818 RepID=A0A2I0AM59_9ASPA|nr:Heterogeneous nuclear ribonucleoprotein 1 [Apostasia shenzhenica]
METRTAMEEMPVEADGEENNREQSGGAEAAVGGAASEGDGRSPSSSDSESDEEGAEKIQIETLGQQLQENPLNYEAHVQYIQCLRKLGDVEKLRQARESMNHYFPLNPKMWQEWTKDEVSLTADCEGFREIEKLYDRGVHEYLSVPLWCDYIEFVQEYDSLVSECSPAGVSKMRTLFERALTAAGLHATEGHKIWDAYREFEQAIFLTIDESNGEEKVKQAQRIRTLFHRQLSVPLSNLRSTLIDYKIWEADQGNAIDVHSEFEGVPSNIVSAYQKALEMYNARASYEEQMASHDASDVDRLQNFVNYVKFEESFGDPARVQVIYERAVAEYPVSSDLWLGFTRYLDRTLKVSNTVIDVYSRATRNCTWVGELWICYLLALERMSAPEKNLKTVFEQAIQCSFPSFKEYLDLFLTRVDGLRRRISSEVKEDTLDYSLIRETFQRAVDYLSPQVVSLDDLLHLHAYWARLEASLGNDFVAARGVWESLIKKSGSLLDVWKGYITMEIGYNHVNDARSIYKRCYSKRFQGTGSEDICHSWLRFEREYGTLDDFDLAVKKVTPRLQEIAIFKAQQESKSSSFSNQNNLVSNASQKRKSNKTFGDKQPPAKKRKDAASKPLEASHRDPASTAENINNDKTDDTQAVTFHGTIGGKPIEEDAGDSKSNTNKPFYTDRCTVFVSNLSLEATEQHLKDFFLDCGGVSAIRILRDKFNGRSRGLAYVDFSDEEHLATAVAKNRQKLLGKKLSIARSDPREGQRKSFSDNISSRGRGRGGRFRSDRKSPGEASGSAVKDERGRADRPARKVTFAAPRAVTKPLGWSRREESKIDDETPEKPKSNDEFREMFLKK